MTRTSSHAPLFFDGPASLAMLAALLRPAVPSPTRRTFNLPSAPSRRADIDEGVARAEELLGVSLARPVGLLTAASRRPRSTADRRFSVCSLPLTRDAFLPIGEGLYICSPPFAYLRTLAQGASDVEALLLGFELCGTYRTLGPSDATSYDEPALASVRELRSFVARNRSLNGAARTMRIIDHLSDGSASPRETQLALLLGLPCSRGGGGLGMPQMNREVAASRQAQLMSGRRSFRCDLSWPNSRLDVDYQSREVHGNEASRIDDSRRANALKLMNWDVFWVTNEELNSSFDMIGIIETLRRRLGKDPRIRVRDYRERMLTLRLSLGLPVDSWLH